MTEVRDDTLRGGGSAGRRAAASLFRERRRFTLTLLAPAALILLVFQVVPILMGVDASLRRFSLTDEEHPFIGLRNYRRILTDLQFRGRPPQHLLLHVRVGGGRSGARPGHCHAAEAAVPGRTLVRTLIVFPLMVAPVVASIMIAWIFNDQFGSRT